MTPADEASAAGTDDRFEASESTDEECEEESQDGPIAQLDAIQRQLDDAANDPPVEEVVVDPYGETRTVVLSPPRSDSSGADALVEIASIQPVPLIGPESESPEVAVDYAGDPVYPPCDEEASEEGATARPCTVPLRVDSQRASGGAAKEQAPRNRSRSMGNLFSRLRRM